MEGWYINRARHFLVWVVSYGVRFCQTLFVEAGDVVLGHIYTSALRECQYFTDNTNPTQQELSMLEIIKPEMYRQVESTLKYVKERGE